MGVRVAVTLRDVHVLKLSISVDRVVGAVTVRMFLAPPRCLVHLRLRRVMMSKKKS